MHTEPAKTGTGRPPGVVGVRAQAARSTAGAATALAAVAAERVRAAEALLTYSTARKVT